MNNKKRKFQYVNPAHNHCNEVELNVMYLDYPTFIHKFVPECIEVLNQICEWKGYPERFKLVKQEKDVK